MTDVATKCPILRWGFRASLVALIALAAAGAWARFLVQQRSDWSPVAWSLNPQAPLGPQLQAGLVKETAANPPILGQALAIHAPRLGLDGVWVAGEDVRADDGIRVASNIKPFVAVAALKLVEQGALQLDAPIGPYLTPKMAQVLASKPEVKARITLRQLLSHASGLRDYGDSPVFQALAYVPTAFGLAWHWTPEVEVWIATHLLPIGAQDSHFAYSDTNYLLASDMIAKASGHANAGLALRALLDWSSLGAPRTFWESYEAAPPNTRIARHFRGGIEDTHLDVSFDQYGGGGLVMPIRDLVMAHRAVVRGTSFAKPEATRTIMQTPTTAEGSGGYALGLSKVEIDEVVCWSHGGRWGTYALDCPSIDFSVARSWGQSNSGPDLTDPQGPILPLIRAAKSGG